MNKINELRKSKGLSQTALANELGISQSTLSYWERGDYEPDNDSLIKIADFFNVSTDYLLGRTDTPNPPKNKKDLVTESNEAECVDGTIIFHRDGKTSRKKFTKEQMDLAMRLLEQLPSDDDEHDYD